MSAQNNGKSDNLSRLIQQKEELEQQIKQQMAIERSLKIAAIVADMKTYGITAADLEKAVKRKTATVRYINPETGATWSGNGRLPKWIQQAKQAGVDIETFAVK